MKILKQLTKNNKGYLPTVAMYTYAFKLPELMVDMKLPEHPTDAQLDQLRLALVKWSKDCGFGKLAEEWYPTEENKCAR